MQMGILSSLGVAQDNMCEFFKAIKCDGPTMIPKTNCFFVMLKNKIHINDFKSWLDEFSVRTELVSQTRIRLSVQTKFLDDSGSVFATCLQEMCPMDVTTRKERMVADTTLPEDMELTDNAELNFEKMTFDLSEENLVQTKQIDATNIDIYKHTNNLEYVRFMLSTFDMDFIENNTLTDIEIHYICESRFGDNLKIFRRIENDVIYFQINNGDKVITKAIVNYQKHKHVSIC
jgi:acyl-ACP thioesterase